MNTLASQIVRARRNRLSHWIKINYDDSRPAFVQATGINKGELSGLLREKSFGEKRARAIEKLAAMPAGYLVNPLTSSETAIDDSPLGPPKKGVQLSAEEAELLSYYRCCPAELRPALLASAKAISHS